MNFSVIVPAFNTEKYLDKCVDSVFQNLHSDISIELIVIDDCSTDKTPSILKELEEKYVNLIALKTPENSGPGAARNVGIKNATGEWVLFLDSDDYYHKDIFIHLKKFINYNRGKPLDAIGFNWAYNPKSSNPPCTQLTGRIDTHHLQQEKRKMIKGHLRMWVDNAVIYTAVRRELIIKHNILFDHGYFEDMDYSFKVYWYARAVSYLDQVLYYKTSRADSIVNTVSTDHSKGFMRAYQKIGQFLNQQDKNIQADYQHDFLAGLVALIATRAREIYKNLNDPKVRSVLYQDLYNSWENFENKPDDENLPYDKTLYSMICQHFLEIMKDSALYPEEKEVQISQFLKNSQGKRWGCTYLHHSVFLRPNEINTCCKRFFVNNEMRGDVTIVNSSEIQASGIMANQIFESKKNLYVSINKGEETPCDGCPFLEFKKWYSFEKEAKIKNLSFEYHSVCNLQCTYCSDIYHGGEKAKYDINALVNDLIYYKKIDENAIIIWGGGEPVLDKNFPDIICSIVDKLPAARHRIITNAVTHSQIVEDLLSVGRASIYTSMDAGTPETYQKIRGRDKFYQALENLKKYSAANARNVTIKYVFTDGNKTKDEVESFAKVVKDYELLDCTFQLSINYKEEHIQIKSLVLMVLLYQRMTDAGARLIFLDELIRQMLVGFEPIKIEAFHEQLKEMGLYNTLAHKDEYPSIVIYGAGEQAKLLIENSMFFKDAEIAFLIDSTPEKQGTKYFGHDIFLPEKLLKTDLPIMIAATQNYSLIYTQLLNLGISKERLIKKLIL